MRIITEKPTFEFGVKHPETRFALERWRKLAKTTDFLNFDELKRTFPSVDKHDKFTIFDIGGNKARLIAVIHYNRRIIYIRQVLTHAEYDTDKWKNDLK